MITSSPISAPKADDAAVDMADTDVEITRTTRIPYWKRLLVLNQFVLRVLSPK